MKILNTAALVCIIASIAILAFWHVAIQQLNTAPPVPSEQIQDWNSLWSKYPFFASGLLLSGARPFSGKPNDIEHISRTYLRVVTLRDKTRFGAWFGITSGIILLGIATWEKRENIVKPEPTTKSYEGSANDPPPPVS